MDPLLQQLIFVVILILANGFFSGSELAIISARRGKIARMTSAGDARARLVDHMQKDSSRFLATVQVGVTVVGTLASAVGGSAAADYLRPVFRSMPVAWMREFAEPLSLATVVAVIAYLSLILGELVPKSIGLRFADAFALAVARPLFWLSRIAGPVVWFLTASTQAVLSVFGLKARDEKGYLTREEMLDLVVEGGKTGVLTDFEHFFIQNSLRFIHTQAHEVMVPRVKIAFLNAEASWDEVMAVVSKKLFSRYPVYRGDMENIVGFVHTKDLLLTLAGSGAPPELGRHIRPIPFVPETSKVTDVIRSMQRHKNLMAMVVDEYGGISGLLTLEDLIEELVGESEDEYDVGEFRVRRQPDGSLLVDAMMPIGDVEDLLNIPREEHDFETVAGLLLEAFGHIPKQGERMAWKGYDFTCVVVTRQSISRVLIRKRPSVTG